MEVYSTSGHVMALYVEGSVSLCLPFFEHCVIGFGRFGCRVVNVFVESEFRVEVENILGCVCVSSIV